MITCSATSCGVAGLAASTSPAIRNAHMISFFIKRSILILSILTLSAAQP